MNASETAHVSRRQWIAVFGAALGAFMAVLDIQITNSSISEIQASLAATLDEGSWVSTSYLVAEIIVIPLTPWLAQAFSRKRYFLVNAALFVLFSLLCGIAQNLPTMICLRVLQGFTGGALIPLAFDLILRTLPVSKRSIGLAIFGITATFAPAIGPTLGGWVTQAFGWQYIFYLNILPGMALICALAYAMDSEQAHMQLLKKTDWFGIATMALGLGSLQVVLEEGNRKDWLGSELIVILSILCVFSLVTFIWWELRQSQPFIALRLLARRNFSLSTVANIAVGAALYGPLYLIPLYLAQIHDYNALQIGSVLMWFGLPQLLVAPIVPKLMEKIDARILICGGLSIFAFSFWLNAWMSNDFAGPQFVMIQVIRAMGLPFVFVPLSSVATENIEKENLDSASALFNMTRNLGGSLGIALVSTLLTKREHFHSERIGESVSIYSPAFQERIASTLNMTNADSTVVFNQALAMLDATVRREALVMSYNDCFLFFAGASLIGCLATMCLAKPSITGPIEVH